MARCAQVQGLQAHRRKMCKSRRPLLPRALFGFEMCEANPCSQSPGECLLLAYRAELGMQRCLSYLSIPKGKDSGAQVTSSSTGDSAESVMAKK